VERTCYSPERVSTEENHNSESRPQSEYNSNQLPIKYKAHMSSTKTMTFSLQPGIQHEAQGPNAIFLTLRCSPQKKFYKAKIFT